MSSKARRLVQPATVASYDLAHVPEPAESTSLVAAAPADGEPAGDARQGQSPDLIGGRTIDEIEREAFARGLAHGERAAAAAAASHIGDLRERLATALEDLVVARVEMIRQTERQMVELALAVARRVVHREVALDPDLLVAMARVALERLGESGRMTVRLHPEEFAATADLARDTWAGSGVQVVADARVGRGGCRVESDFGAVDAGVDAQIQELARALLGDRRSVDRAEAAA
jgi:flagellar assembly protein FliH